MVLSAGTALSADLVISNWAGYMAPDIAETFKAATGLTIEVVNHATNEEIMGKLMASQGKGYDVVFVSSPFAHILNGQGLLEPLGHADGAEPQEPLSGSDQAGLRSGQYLCRSLCLGHDGSLLSLRSGRGNAGQLVRSA